MLRALIGLWRLRGHELLMDEGGQAITEYVLILATVALFATTLARRILGVLDDGIKSIGGQLEKDLRTGRTSLSAYKN